MIAEFNMYDKDKNVLATFVLDKTTMEKLKTQIEKEQTTQSKLLRKIIREYLMGENKNEKV